MQLAQSDAPRKSKSQRRRERRARTHSLYTLRQVIDHIHETIAEAPRRQRRTVDSAWNWNKPLADEAPSQ